ncbi:MAG: hypothetical protein DRO01_02490 [Thermoproteota archaeon]|nr:MAG: hypothetical protein DRO01_02490 [Candidatus Korarchaeota archaeon]
MRCSGPLALLAAAVLLTASAGFLPATHGLGRSPESACPGEHPSLREFPSPFVRNGTVDYDWDGSPDVAIVVGTHGGSWVAPEDLKAAVLLGAKVGSHLYLARLWDSYANLTGEWRGTRLLDPRNGDATPPGEVDLIYQGEDVFSFVRAPLVWSDVEVLDESYEPTQAALELGLLDRELILVGGPRANRLVDYLNDSGLLWIPFVGGRPYDSGYCGGAGGAGGGAGYVDLEWLAQVAPQLACGHVRGVGVVQYARGDPWGERENRILVVAGDNRYGTLMAAVALADPTRIVRVPRDSAVAFYDPSRVCGREFPAVVVAGVVEVPGGSGPCPPPKAAPPASRIPIVVILWPWPAETTPVGRACAGGG